MINQKEVIRMKVPYPTVSDQLALVPHMYICKESRDQNYEFVKCQTLKPHMLINSTMQHYCDEEPDLTRNPFQRTTRIDCDKIFTTNSVSYSLNMRTTVRPDVCDDLFNAIIMELIADGNIVIDLNEDDLKNINSLVSAV